MKTTAQLVREYRGPAIFSFGFRPFFLLASIWSALAVPLWVAGLHSGNGFLAAAVTYDWHVHEMLFAYTGAVIVGYMIIAGANWTGRYPVAGRPVIVLVMLWLAGRLAMLLAGQLGVAAYLIDVSFLVLFAGALWREQLAARNWRNLVPCVVVTSLGLADILFHTGQMDNDLAAAAVRLALGLVCVLIAVMGGRLVPSFTRNSFSQRGITSEPAPYGHFDTAAALLTAAAFFLWLLFPSRPATGVLLCLAGLGTSTRMLRWKGWLAVRDSMTMMLHIGYSWLAAGQLLLGISILRPADMPQAAAIHALSAGAIGVMTLAVMTRTSRSHTGRKREADGSTLVIYTAVNVAAGLRVLAPFLVSAYTALLTVSAVAWSLAFGLFALAYGPMLIAPRKRQASTLGR